MTASTMATKGLRCRLKRPLKGRIELMASKSIMTGLSMRLPGPITSKLRSLLPEPMVDGLMTSLKHRTLNDVKKFWLYLRKLGKINGVQIRLKMHTIEALRSHKSSVTTRVGSCQIHLHSKTTEMVMPRVETQGIAEGREAMARTSLMAVHLPTLTTRVQEVASVAGLDVPANAA